MEDNKKSIAEKVGKTALGVMAAPISASIAAALSPSKQMPSTMDSAKYGAKVAYYGATDDKEGMEKADKEFEAAKKRLANKETKAPDYEKTNASGDSYKEGGKVRSSASKRADGCIVKGFTRA
jgi:hypothetical protein